MIEFFRKLLKLIKLVDKIDIEEDSKQIRVIFRKNLLVSTDENILFASGKHMIIKTGSKEPGLLFLNPKIESTSDVSKSVEESELDRKRHQQQINKIDYGKKDCDI